MERDAAKALPNDQLLEILSTRQPALLQN
jgi:hypothetical protein